MNRKPCFSDFRPLIIGVRSFSKLLRHLSILAVAELFLSVLLQKAPCKMKGHAVSVRFSLSVTSVHASGSPTFLMASIMPRHQTRTNNSCRVRRLPESWYPILSFFIYGSPKFRTSGLQHHSFILGLGKQTQTNSNFSCYTSNPFALNMLKYHPPCALIAWNRPGLVP